MYAGEFHRSFVFTYILSQHKEEIDDMLGLASELGSQRRILRCNAHRASVQMALSHHRAAHYDQRGRTEAKLIGTQDRSHHHIETGAQLAISLYNHPAHQTTRTQTHE